MPAKAGHLAQILVPGAGIAFTGEAFATISANTVYQITNTVKRVWDPALTITVKKDGAAQAASLVSINRLTGTVTFLADIGGGHTITADGTYLPMSVAGQAKTYSYTLTGEVLDVSKFGDTNRTRIQGLKDISGNLTGWKQDAYFTTALRAGTPVVLEFWSDSTSTFDYRVWVNLNKQQVADAVAVAITETIDFVGVVDADLRNISS